MGQFSQNIMYSLCSIYVRSTSHHSTMDQPFDKYLPIRHWAKTVEKNSWTLGWHIPSDGEVDYASSLIKKLIFDPLDVLSKPESLSDNEIIKNLTLIRMTLEGCSNLCPLIDDEVMSLIPMNTPNVQLETSTMPSHMKRIYAMDGGNLRRALFSKMDILGDFLLTHKENDTKACLQFVNIIRILLHVKGIDTVYILVQSVIHIYF